MKTKKSAIKKIEAAATETAPEITSITPDEPIATDETNTSDEPTTDEPTVPEPVVLAPPSKQTITKEKQMVVSMLHYLEGKTIPCRMLDAANPTNQTNNRQSLEIHGILDMSSDKPSQHFQWRIFMDPLDLDEKSLPKRFIEIIDPGREDKIIIRVSKNEHLHLSLNFYQPAKSTVTVNQ